MKLHYIHPTITTIAIEPSSLMAGSGSAKNQILLDAGDGSVGNTLNGTLNDYGNTGKIDDARSKGNSSSIWD